MNIKCGLAETNEFQYHNIIIIINYDQIKNK